MWKGCERRKGRLKEERWAEGGRGRKRGWIAEEREERRRRSSRGQILPFLRYGPRRDELSKRKEGERHEEGRTNEGRGVSAEEEPIDSSRGEMAASVHQEV